MIGQTYLDPSLTLRPAHPTDIKGVAKLNYDVAEMEGRQQVTPTVGAW